MSRRILLVRHPPVAESLRGVCYGRTDVPLSDAGREQIPGIVDRVLVLAGGPITHLVHGGLARCAAVAETLASRCGIAPLVDPRLRERCFGDWELRRWDDIHAETGDAMMGMVTDPATWRPPGGETTFEMRDRVLAWHADLPAEGTVVVATHAGPAAALVGALRGIPASDWPRLIPPTGGVVVLV